MIHVSNLLSRKAPAATAALAAITLVVVASASLGAFLTSGKSYAVSTDADYVATPLLSVGDQVPETSNLTKAFQMIGIPDGLGAHSNGNGTVTVYMNHELTGGTTSEPVVGDPFNRGAFVSKYIVNATTGHVISGERAYDTVYLDDTLVGPAAAVGNATRAFSRFCSASLGGPEHGFDRHIFFTNEEEGTPANTFDQTGGLAVAVFDNQAHALTYLGRFAWENTVPKPNPGGNRVVIMGMEDGPADMNRGVENSQLYMYVGEKDPDGDTVLEKNGLVGGTLYVFRAKNTHQNSEADVQNGTVAGEWVAIPGANGMSESTLEAASDAVDAMIFARPEDGAFNPRNTNEYFFVTTGGAAGANELGRLYSLRLNPSDPTKDATLSILYNADEVVAAGGDIALSPDNIDTSGAYLMIQEDGTTESRAVMAAKGRDGSIWRFPLKSGNGVDVAERSRVVRLNPPGRTGSPAINPGVWETSGIIAADQLFGAGSWLFDVQAHGPTPAPVANTVEDGQLLLLRRTP